MIRSWTVIVAWSICRHAARFVRQADIVRCSAGTLRKNEVLIQYEVHSVSGCRHSRSTALLTLDHLTSNARAGACGSFTLLHEGNNC